MKRIVLIALALTTGAAIAGTRSDETALKGLMQSTTGALTTSVFEAKGRKGSHRVGGSGRSGKGGRYVGGRK